MKRAILYICIVAGLLWRLTPASRAEEVGGNTATFGSTQAASRADPTSNYIDWWQVRTGPGLIMSVFGYNSGPQQWLQIYDSPQGPTVAVTAWDQTAKTFTATNHGLSNGERVQLTNTVASITAGFYYVGYTNSFQFYLYDTAAHAYAGGATGLQNVSGATSTATFQRLPIHTFAIAASDNFSCIVPVTGITCEKGIVLADSTTAATYTGGNKNFTAMITFRQP